MRRLHVVGFTADLDGLIFSTRKGSKSGGFVVAIGDELLGKLAEAERLRNGGDGSGAGPSGGDRAPRREERARPASELTPREIQARLRAGRSIDEVAKEARVDREWVERFAAPILAEQAQVVELAKTLTYSKSRLGESTLPLGESVAANLVERGVRFLEDEFDAGWSAFQLHDSVWMVRFEYRSRGRQHQAAWEIDVAGKLLTSRDRHASDLAYVERGRRVRGAGAEDSEPETLEPIPHVRVVRPARRRSVTVAPAPSRAARRPPRERAATKPAVAKPAVTKKRGAATKAGAAKAVVGKSAAAKASAAKTPAATKRAATNTPGRKAASTPPRPTARPTVASSAKRAAVATKPAPVTAKRATKVTSSAKVTKATKTARAPKPTTPATTRATKARATTTATRATRATKGTRPTAPATTRGTKATRAIKPTRPANVRTPAKATSPAKAPGRTPAKATRSAGASGRVPVPTRSPASAAPPSRPAQPAGGPGGPGGPGKVVPAPRPATSTRAPSESAPKPPVANPSGGPRIGTDGSRLTRTPPGPGGRPSVPPVGLGNGMETRAARPASERAAALAERLAAVRREPPRRVTLPRRREQPQEPPGIAISPRDPLAKKDDTTEEDDGAFVIRPRISARQASELAN